jgi:hypothetical protein
MAKATSQRAFGGLRTAIIDETVPSATRNQPNRTGRLTRCGARRFCFSTSHPGVPWPEWLVAKGGNEATTAATTAFVSAFPENPVTEHGAVS